MLGLRQFAFPSNPLAILVLAATVGAVWLLAPRGQVHPGGLSVTRSVVATPAGRVPVSVVQVSLADAGYRVTPVVAGRRVSRLDAAAAIVGDSWSPVTGIPSGRLMIGGRQLVAGDPNRPVLALRPGRAQIGTGLQGWPDMVSGRAVLIEHGSPVALGPGGRELRERRTAVALRGGRLWLVAAGGRGLTDRELQRFLVSRGATSAIEFAGGPNADLAVSGRPALGGPEPVVPEAIAIQHT
jgi:hypothetical protein